MITMIDGVHIKTITRHNDERGYFAELTKKGEAGSHEVAQTSYAITKPGVIKAFHYHDYWESWAVLRGRALLVMHDIREGSPTHGETQTVIADEEHPILLSIPPGVAHGYSVLGNEDVGMLYHAEEVYDGSRKDQIRTIPFDSKDIGFDWKASYE
jgi:dTDP-4-dehydrorhamnose 3,5-epimerase